MLDTLAASTTEFLTRMGEQQDANTLYTELIALFPMGKALFATTDARKFEDHVVTNTPVIAVVPVPAKT